MERAHYQSLLSRIYAEWNEFDWLHFRESTCVPNPLTTMHEASHWLQRQTLVERSLHLVTVRALLENQEGRSPGEKEELRKVIAFRKLLSPISEGLALYTQFDYFPANFFIGAGKRSPYDALIEFLLARRGFEETEGTRFDLASVAWEALSNARLSELALQKKRELLLKSFLTIDDHVTGYLIIKASVARARCNSHFEFLHDGHLLPLIMSLFYNCPEFVQIVLDSTVGAIEAIYRVSLILQQRLELLLDGKTLANLVSLTRDRVPDFENTVALNQDAEEYDAAEKLYSSAYNAMLKPIRSSLGKWIRPEQTVDDYLEETFEGKDGDPPYPLDAHQLLSSPHFGRLFTADVKIAPKGESADITFRATNQTVESPANVSPRAQRYGWIRYPENEVEGRLTEAITHLHGLRHEFFNVSFISHERGILTLSHNTRDVNIGYGVLGLYLQDAYRIDQWLSRIDLELRTFAKKEFKHTTEVSLAKEKAYRDGISSAVRAVLPAEVDERRSASWINGRNIFNTEEEMMAYIAFSLAVRLGDFSFESKADLHSTVKRSLGRFPSGVFNEKKALRFISSREQVCCVQRFNRRVVWWSFSCLL